MNGDCQPTLGTHVFDGTPDGYCHCGKRREGRETTLAEHMADTGSSLATWNATPIEGIVPDGVEPAVCPQCQGGIGHDGEPYCQADCPTITEPHAITRELAERGPFLSTNLEYEEASCADCGIEDNVDLTNPASHEPTCLWKRAVDLVATR